MFCQCFPVTRGGWTNTELGSNESTSSFETCQICHKTVWTCELWWVWHFVNRSIRSQLCNFKDIFNWPRSHPIPQLGSHYLIENNFAGWRQGLAPIGLCNGSIFNLQRVKYLAKYTHERATDQELTSIVKLSPNKTYFDKYFFDHVGWLVEGVFAEDDENWRQKLTLKSFEKKIRFWILF